MGWVCLQVTQWPRAIKDGTSPAPSTHWPTSLSHCCIHKWHGCDRTACRAHRLRSACGRISQRNRLCMCQRGRPHHCRSCCHTFRKCIDILKEKEEEHSGLGYMGHGKQGPPPLPPPPTLVRAEPGVEQGKALDATS